MGKVYRQDRKSVQRIKAKEIVPGDIVEIAGKHCILYHDKDNVSLSPASVISLNAVISEVTAFMGCFEIISNSLSALLSLYGPRTAPLYEYRYFWLHLLILNGLCASVLITCSSALMLCTEAYLVGSFGLLLIFLRLLFGDA